MQQELVPQLVHTQALPPACRAVVVPPVPLQPHTTLCNRCGLSKEKTQLHLPELKSYKDLLVRQGTWKGGEEKMGFNVLAVDSSRDVLVWPSPAGWMGQHIQTGLWQVIYPCIASGPS